MQIKQIEMPSVYNNIFHNVIFYQELNSTTVLNNYVDDNFASIELRLKKEGIRFIRLGAKALTKKSLNTLTYFHPELSGIDFSNLTTNPNLKDVSLISIDSLTNLISFNSDDIVNEFEAYLVSLENHYPFTPVISNDENQLDDIDFMLSGDVEESDDYISLESDVKERLDNILKEYQALKNNGQLLSVLPVIENYLRDSSPQRVSQLHIDKNYNIFLIDYNNLEVKLRPLTKALYLLFLNHKEGIHLKDLMNHKVEFLELYKSLTEREDYDKLIISANQILDFSTKEVYVHLSRIRSAFTALVNPDIAELYYISGAKNQAKNITFNSKNH